jgi:hypothetical protein
VTLISRALCKELGVPVRVDPMATTLYGVKGMKFKTGGLATFTVQLGEPGEGIRFDIVDARVTEDDNRTLLWGMDIMSGSIVDGKRVMLPWKVDLSGKVEIGLRMRGLPAKVTVPLKVLEENVYNPAWDAEFKKEL